MFERVSRENRKGKDKNKEINLKKIIVFAIIIPLSGFLGVEIGIGALLGGGIGGIIAYLITKN